MRLRMGGFELIGWHLSGPLEEEEEEVLAWLFRWSHGWNGYQEIRF